MPTVFTRIIDGELPGRFVWRDERCTAFLSINPIARGHTLVVPIEEIDHWIDMDPDLNAHCAQIARTIGRAQMAAFSPTRIGLMIAGLEVPHAHLHVLPIDSEQDLSFLKAASDPDQAEMDQAQQAILGALVAEGHDPGVAGSP